MEIIETNINTNLGILKVGIKKNEKYPNEYIEIPLSEAMKNRIHNLATELLKEGITKINLELTMIW